MIQIYLMHTELLRDPYLYQHALENCSIERRNRFERLRTEDDKCRSLAASVLLDVALRKRGLREKDAEYGYGAAGKPCIPARKDFHFSLSHSGQLVICAVSEQEIGADIQIRRQFSAGVQQRFFTEREREHMEMLRLWTLKESYGKLTGEGLAVMERTEIPPGFPVKLLRDGIRQNVFFYEKELEQTYYLATCVQENPSFTVETNMVNRSDLI